jgi:hypothetical protein
MVPAPFIAVVDANVLFPLTLRDTVLRGRGWLLPTSRSSQRYRMT